MGNHANSYVTRESDDRLGNEIICENIDTLYQAVDAIPAQIEGRNDVALLTKCLQLRDALLEASETYLCNISETNRLYYYDLCFSINVAIEASNALAIQGSNRNNGRLQRICREFLITMLGAARRYHCEIRTPIIE